MNQTVEEKTLLMVASKVILVRCVNHVITKIIIIKTIYIIAKSAYNLPFTYNYFIFYALLFMQELIMFLDFMVKKIQIIKLNHYRH